MPVGELFLSAFLQVLFDRLASRELLQFLRQEGLYSEIEKWEETLEMIQAVLGDAEDKQLKDIAVKKWLDKLQDLAYDAEDMVDEFATEAFARKLKMEQHRQASTSKVRNLLPACFNNRSPRAIKFNIRMGSEIKNVTSRLEELCKLRDNLGLKEITGGTSSTVPVYRTRPTTSLQTETTVFGRNEDATKILDMVKSTGESGDANFRVISIVGMGGIRKTTLAQKVFNDEAVKDFNPKAWTCVSVDFDVLRISKAILESITGSSCDLKELDAVQKKLKEAVDGKKFLLVLDDVWSKDLRSWELLRSPFKAGAVGSKIIVTTRDEDVALLMGAPKECHRLKILSDEECWSLFKAHAFLCREIASYGDIELIRQKVIEKCKGLPLAVKTLAGLLRSKEEREDEWLEVLSSKMWDLVEERDDIPATLKLSYYYLPSHLKRCFAHCAIFLEDYEFLEEELVHLWMAEGLIQPAEENQQLEDLGHEYFDALLSRSFFQQSSVNESKHAMHDLVYDLAKWASGATCYHLEGMTEAIKPPRSFKKVRHLSFAPSHYDRKCKFEVLKEVEQVDQCLRTFLPLDFNRFGSSYITPTVILDLLPKFKKLRMLSLEGYNVTELPESFGDLRYLRFLNLSGTMIKSLPESTSSLFHLQILKLRYCSRLKKLPSKIRNLINLRYLDIRGAYLDEMPLGLNELKCLRYLSNFIVGKSFGIGLENLKSLKSLCGEHCISRLENVDLHETREMILNDKQKLKVLQLVWNSQFDDTRNEVREKEVLGLLRPHPNLEKLTIIYYGGLEFPSWVGDSSFSKMTSLTLYSCEKCTLLPSLGMLGSLKDLTIGRMKGLKSIGKEICGQRCSTPFQSLQTLGFVDLQEWEHWEPIKDSEYGSAFPCLREFSVLFCPKFSGRLPERLPLLEKLVIKNCKQLEVSFSSLPMLSKLEIDGCKQLACNSPMDSKSLKSMTLADISEFGRYSNTNTSLLEFLSVRKCPSLKCLSSSVPLPETLQHLYVQDCSQLTMLSSSGHLPHTLCTLSLDSLPKLESIAESFQNNKSLEEISVWRCRNLKSVPLQSLHNLGHHLKIEIHSCESIDCLGEEGPPNTNLSELTIEDCEKLKALPNWFHSLNSLNRLTLRECPSLTSFSEEGFPTNLTSLSIEGLNVKMYKAVLEWGLHNLTTLTYLKIRRLPEAESFPLQEMEMTFPPSLTHLFIYDFPNLKCLMGKGFRNLNSLEYLDIYGCPNLTSFPKLTLASSLKFLSISSCPNLKSFSKLGLPSSLLELSIWRCPKLKEECKRDKGKEWTKISRIPSVVIDERYIYGPEEEE